MKQLLLIGAGHAHAQVLASFAQAPVAGVQITVVSPSALAPYSGMVPGWLAGTYAFEDICIDFAALARAAGARLVIDEVQALDAAARTVQLAGGAVLTWDLLSLNVGSTLQPPAGLPGQVLSLLRPLGRLRAAWEELLGGPGTRRRPHPRSPACSPWAAARPGVERLAGGAGAAARPAPPVWPSRVRW